MTSPTFGRFGKQTIGGTVASPINADTKFVTQAFAPEDGSVTMLSVWLRNTGNSIQSFLAILHGASGTLPGALLGRGDQELLVAPGASGWFDMPLRVAVPIVAGQRLFMGYQVGPTGGQTGFAYDAGVGREIWSTDAFVDGPSDPFGTITGADTTNDLSIYATYQVATPPLVTPPTTPGIKYKQNYAAAMA